MKRIEGHVRVMPPVYEIEFGQWRWCKLGEVCEVVWALREVTELNFTPTATELVSRFAALVRPNRLPKDVDGEKKKIFRYSRDGISFWGTEVPQTHPAPPYIPFKLDIEAPYPPDLFVPEGWAIDTLNAVRRGCVAAADFGKQRVGFGAMQPGQRLSCIVLDGPKFEGMVLFKFPDCVQL